MQASLRHLIRPFVKALCVITLLYCGWLLAVYVASNRVSTSPSPTSSAEQSSRPYADLAAAYEQLQQQLRTADSTHLIRRYHGRHALFSADRVFDEQVMALSREAFRTQIGRDRVFLDLPPFDWQFDEVARPIDALKMTFRGNGIPATEEVERLARSGLIDPTLQGYYAALIEQNTLLWHDPKAAVQFAVPTAQGGFYIAYSVPFIAIQRLSKEYFAQMQSAALPFLGRAYSDDEAQQARRQSLLSEQQGPIISAQHPTQQPSPAPLDAYGPRLPRTKAEVMASHPAHARPARAPEETAVAFDKSSSGENLLDSLPEIADALQRQQQPSVSSFTMDTQQVERLFHENLAEQSGSVRDALHWRKAIQSKRQQGAQDSETQRHLARLARLDPEFMTLFLVQSLFEQYNLFSVFEEGVRLVINALDTRLNVLYVSYNMQFDPMPVEVAEGCGNQPVSISDEYFLIAAVPHSYLIRVYLPTCHLSAHDFDKIDGFLGHMRILH
jgi:hypothetical protein